MLIKMGVQPEDCYVQDLENVEGFAYIRRLKDHLQNKEVGDSVVTTGGFYGVILDITDDDVIVEFGNNKNCRIPMRKSAIAEVEKANAVG